MGGGGRWGSYYTIPKAIFYLLKGDYTSVEAHRGPKYALNPKP